MKHYLLKNRSLPLRDLKLHTAHIGHHKKHHVKGGAIGLAGSTAQPAWGPIRENIPVESLSISGEGVRHRKHIKPLHIRF